MIASVDPFQNERLRALADLIAEEMYFDPYDSSYRENDQTLANGAFEAFVKGGRDAAEQFCREYVENSGWTPREQLLVDIRKKLPEHEDALASILADDPILAALVAYDLEEVFIDAIADRAEQNSGSKPLDIIPKSVDILVAYLPGLPDGLGVEDQSIHAISVTLPGDLAFVPGPALLAFFQFANVGKSEWFDFIKDVHGIDLVDPQSGAAKYPRHQSAFEDLAKHWQIANWAVDATRPKVVSLADIDVIIDNTADGAVPALFVKLPLLGFIEKVDMSLPFDLSPGRHGNVGAFGLHNFVNGSGHVENFIRGAVTIEPGQGQWLASEKPNGFLYGIRTVYGPVESYLSPVMTPNRVPSPAVATPDLGDLSPEM